MRYILYYLYTTPIQAPPQDTGPADPPQEDSYDDAKQEEPAGENGEAAPTDSMNTDEQGQVKSEDNGVPTSTTGGGNLYLRPAFLGNLSHQCLSSDVENLFNNPTPSGPNVQAGEVMPAFKLDRVVRIYILYCVFDIVYFVCIGY